MMLDILHRSRLQFNLHQDVLNIITTLKVTQAAKIQIVNLQGLVVKTFEIQQGTQLVVLDVKSLRNGIYIVHEINFGMLLESC